LPKGRVVKAEEVMKNIISILILLAIVIALIIGIIIPLAIRTKNFSETQIYHIREGAIEMELYAD